MFDPTRLFKSSFTWHKSYARIRQASTDKTTHEFLRSCTHYIDFHFTHTWTYMHRHCTRTHTHTCTHIRTHMHTHTYTHAHTCIHTCTHKYAHTRTVTHTCTTHALPHSYTHTPVSRDCQSWPGFAPQCPYPGGSPSLLVTSCLHCSETESSHKLLHYQSITAHHSVCGYSRSTAVVKIL